MSREERWKMIREAGKEYEEDLKRYGDTLYSLGFYLKKLGQSNYKSEIVYKSGEDGGMEPDYTRTPLSAEQAKRLAANIEEQRVKIAARYPRYQEDGMTPFFTVNEKNKSNNVEANAWYEGNAGDENNFSKTKLQSLNYKGQFREQSTHYRSAIIPLTSNITLDGIAGIVPLQLYKINPEKLPLGYQGDDVAAGIRITYKSKYTPVVAATEDLKQKTGLDSGLHTAVLCYMKARMFEDSGDLERAQYFRVMFEKMIKQYPLRKSGVRTLAVPRL